MGWPIVENLSGVCGILFNLFRGPYLNFGKKSKKMLIFIKIPIFPYFSIWSVWGLLLGSFSMTSHKSRIWTYLVWLQFRVTCSPGRCGPGDCGPNGFASQPPMRPTLPPKHNITAAHGGWAVYREFYIKIDQFLNFSPKLS